jgi:hypothetical protein
MSVTQNAKARWFRCLRLLPLILVLLSFGLFAGEHQKPHLLSAVQSHVDRGLQLAQEGDLVGAETELRVAVHLSPKDPQILAWSNPCLCKPP